MPLSLSLQCWWRMIVKILCVYFHANHALKIHRCGRKWVTIHIKSKIYLLLMLLRLKLPNRIILVFTFGFSFRWLLYFSVSHFSLNLLVILPNFICWYVSLKLKWFDVAQFLLITIVFFTLFWIYSFKLLSCLLLACHVNFFR